MADNPFDRAIFNPLEKPLSVDWNQAQSQLDRSMREVLFQFFSRQASLSSYAALASTGFVGEGFFVVEDSPAAMSVIVKAGIGFVDDAADTAISISGISGLDDRSRYKPVALLTPHTFAVPAAPPPGNFRRDIIEIRTNRLVGNPTSRQVLDPSSGAFSPTSVNKTLAFAVDGSIGTVTSPAASTAALSYKTGVAEASITPTVPATTSGYTKLCEILLDETTTSIVQGRIADVRPLLHPGGAVPFALKFRLQWNGGSPIVTTQSWIAPPSCRYFISASGSTRSAFTAYFGGGEIASYSVSVQTDLTISTASINPTQIQTELELNHQDLDQGYALEQRVVAVTAQSFFVDASNFNVTNATLEDVVYHVRGTLSY